MIAERFITDVGNLTQSFGLGRAVGQIFAYLYFSPEPKNLTDLEEALGISRGAASAGVRQLEQWGAVRKVWVKGDRKDYYEAEEWLGKIIKNVITSEVGKKMTAYHSLVDSMEQALPEIEKQNGDSEFIKARIENLKKFHDKIEGTWNSRLLQTLIK